MALQSTISYEDLIPPDQVKHIDDNPHHKIFVPIYFTLPELSRLFAMKAQDLPALAIDAKSANTTDPNSAGLDKALLKEFVGRPDKKASVTVSEDGLIRSFSFLAYASMQGRTVECYVSAANKKGKINYNLAKEWSQIDPAFFRTYNYSPLTGAKEFFAMAASIAPPFREQGVVIAFALPKSEM